MSLTAANGGVLVPQFLDPTINLTNAGTASDVRQIARKSTITVDQWDGVNSAGVGAEWLAEATEAADATPTFVGPTITAHKSAAWVFGSHEVLADSGFDEVGMLVADAFDRLEATAFVSGNGSGQPWGLVSRLSGSGPTVAGTSGAAGAADLVLADTYALDSALDSRWRRNGRWLASKPVWNALREQTSTLENAQAIWDGQLLLDYPRHVADDMDSTIVSGSNDHVLILGDFHQYNIVDRLGTSIMYEPLVKGASQRPTGQAGFYAHRRVGADVLSSNGFKLLVV